MTAEFKKTLLSRDLKYSLFDLFASWSGKFSHTFSALDKRLVILPDQLGSVVQSVTCLTADPGVPSSIPSLSHTLVEIDHEIISMAILPSADSRRVVVSYKRKYVHEVLVNRLVKLAQEKTCG